MKVYLKCYFCQDGRILKTIETSKDIVIESPSTEWIHLEIKEILPHEYSSAIITVAIDNVASYYGGATFYLGFIYARILKKIKN